jgi:hypothetical protein
MCAAELFSQGPNFSVDLAEIICKKLATLVVSRKGKHLYFSSCFYLPDVLVALYKVVHVLLPANGQNTNVILFSGRPEL